MTYKTYTAVLVLSAVATFALTPLVRRLAIRLGAIDQPGGRKVHDHPMPRMGGVAVFGGFCFPWGFFYLLDNRVTATFQNYEMLFATLVFGALAMLLLGVWDDLKGLRAMPKLFAQVLVATTLYIGGYRIEVLSNPFGDAWELGWLAWPASVLWIVGITNAINLLDGIDGLATGVTAAIALALAAISFVGGQIIVALLTLCLAGACIGFLPYNFSPARIFLGDSGSLFLGIVLACIGIISLFKAATATFVLAPVILFGLPLFDSTSVFLGRLRRGVSVFKGDRTHVHHRLLALGLNHRQAALFLYAITLLLGAGAIMLTARQTPAVLILGGILLAGLLGILWGRARRRKGTRSGSPSSSDHVAP